MKTTLKQIRAAAAGRHPTLKFSRDAGVGLNEMLCRATTTGETEVNKKHPLIGQDFTYQNGNDSLEAVCVAVKAGPMVADANSPVGNVKVKSTIKLQLKPANGSPKFWTAPMIYSAA